MCQKKVTILTSLTSLAFDSGIQSDPDPETVRTRMKVLFLEGRLKNILTDVQSKNETLQTLQADNQRLTTSMSVTGEESQRIKAAARLVEDTHKYLTLKLQAANNEIDNVALDSNQLRLQAEKSHYELVDKEKEVEKLTQIILENREQIATLQEAKTVARQGNKRLKASMELKSEEYASLHHDFDEVVRVVEGAGISIERLFAVEKREQEAKKERERREQESVNQQQQQDERRNSDHEQDQPATMTLQQIPDDEPGEVRGEGEVGSPVGVKGVRTLRNASGGKKRITSPQCRGQQQQSQAYRPASAPGGTGGNNLSNRPRSPGGGARLTKGRGKKRQHERCQQCKHIITGKFRTLPSTVQVQEKGKGKGNEGEGREQQQATYVQSLSPEALIQNYLDSGK